MRQPPAAARDLGLRRIRRATSIAFAGAGALLAAFAGLAARSLPGHHAVTTKVTTQSRRPVSHPHQTAPPLVAAQSNAVPPAPAAPAAAPTPTPAPPVVVSGGT